MLNHSLNIKSFARLFVLIRESVRYSLSEKKDDFWSWLFYRVSDPESGIFNNPYILEFLVLDPKNRGECDCVVEVYDILKGHLYNSSIPEEVWDSIKECAEKLERGDIKREIGFCRD